MSEVGPVSARVIWRGSPAGPVPSLAVSLPGNTSRELPMAEGADPDAVLVAERILRDAETLRDAVWRGRLADDPDLDAELAMVTRQAWQIASSRLLDLFDGAPEATDDPRSS